MLRKIFLIKILYFFLFNNYLIAQWVPISIDPPAAIFSIYVSDNTIYSGGDSVLYLSTDGGSVWERSSRVEDVEYGITSIVKWSNKLYVGTAGRGVFETTDNGDSWIPRNIGLDNSGALEISSVAVRGDSLYAATIGEGVFVLNLLNPVQWITFREGLPFGVAWNVNSLYNYNNILICGAGGNASVYFNEYGSSLWVEKSFDLPAPEPNAMIALNSYGDTLIGIAYFGIYRSINNGNSWEYYNPGIGLISFGSITVVNSVVFALISKLGRSYLLSSKDSGADWLFEIQFDNTGYSLEFFNNKLFNGRGNGLYYLPYHPSGIDDIIIPGTIELYQNYPNPFNPGTAIRYQLPVNGYVMLKVFDVLGNEIATMVDEYKPAGRYEVEFNVAQVSRPEISSGIYFYQLKAGDFILTKKMILLK